MRAGGPVSRDTKCDDRTVAKIQELVEIKAPPERVWAVVAEDVTNAPKWTSNLEKVEKLDDGPPGKGTRYRYHLDIAGHKERLEVEQATYTKPKKCAGAFIKGPRKGKWSYTYKHLDHGSTRLGYEMDYELTRLPRVPGGPLGPQNAAAIPTNTH